MQKIRIAGPPGTGKTRYLMKRYYDALDKYQAADIMIMSHTKTTANEIRKKINDPENIAEYHKETGKDLFSLIKETKKTREKNISTIHKYCKNEITKSKGGDVFEISDYDRLKAEYRIFNIHTLTRTFSFIEALFKGHPFFKFVGFARDNGKDLTSYYRTLSYEERVEYKYSIQELVYMNDKYKDYKTNPLINEGRKNVMDFHDMVEKFCDLSKDPVIKVLMIDEAQDSSVIQRRAEVKMSKNCDLFYKAGDPDQSIFEFAGADPDTFHKEFAHPEVELDIGYRCPRVINNWCREVIKDVWDHYEYTRKWTPRRELDSEGKPTGPIVEGKKYDLTSLNQDPNLYILIDKLINTKETFIFTHRSGEPLDILDFLIKLNLPIKLLSDKIRSFSYPTTDVTNQREFISFSQDEPKTLAIAKKILKNIDSEYRGSNYSKEEMEKLERGRYDINYFIKKNYLLPIVKKTKDLQDLVSTNDLKTKNYIRNIVKENRDLDDSRIFVANIHTIKGMEFDHVVLDLNISREEPKYTKKRLKFVAGSRARETLWLIKSKGLSL
jgi:superfamily I DNA/RNA helicase